MRARNTTIRHRKTRSTITHRQKFPIIPEGIFPPAGTIIERGF